MLSPALAFVGTNVDGFLCLAAALAVDPPRSRARVVLSASLAFAALLAISLVAALAVGRIGVAAAWLGIVPAGIGIYRLARLVWRGRQRREDPADFSSAPSIFSIVFATGADNVAVYAPLLASNLGAAWSIGATFLLCWTAGCALLAFVTPDLSRVEALKRFLEPAFAVAFILIGLAIAVRS